MKTNLKTVSSSFTMEMCLRQSVSEKRVSPARPAATPLSCRPGQLFGPQQKC